MNLPDLARFIDFTLLRPGCTQSDIRALCLKAVERGYAAVCVPPYFVSQACAYTNGSGVRVATVVGFPHGMHLTETKITEARLALRMGASELDMVVNLAAYFSGDEKYVRSEIEHLVDLSHKDGALLKVIIETALLSPPQIQELCQWSAAAGVDFVKTSTGFAEKGAVLETVQLMRASLPSSVGIKASGGIRTAEAAWAFIQAGATRIGTSTPL